MDLQEIQRQLRDRNLRKVALGAGIHYNTVRRLANGECINPSWKTISKVSEYLVKR